MTISVVIAVVMNFLSKLTALLRLAHRRVVLLTPGSVVRMLQLHDSDDTVVVTVGPLLSRNRAAGEVIVVFELTAFGCLVTLAQKSSAILP